MGLILALQRLHIPTGARSSEPIDMVNVNFAELFEKVNNWNRQGDGVWKYWVEWVTG